eukprot:scaffold6852_cov134-Isochrysis_galbana.AAC.3
MGIGSGTVAPKPGWRPPLSGGRERMSACDAGHATRHTRTRARGARVMGHRHHGSWVTVSWSSGLRRGRALCCAGWLAVEVQWAAVRWCVPGTWNRQKSQLPTGKFALLALACIHGRAWPCVSGGNCA